MLPYKKHKSRTTGKDISKDLGFAGNFVDEGLGVAIHHDTAESTAAWILNKQNEWTRLRILPRDMVMRRREDLRHQSIDYRVRVDIR